MGSSSRSVRALLTSSPDATYPSSTPRVLAQVVRLVRVAGHVEQHLVGPVPVVAVMPGAEVEVVAETDAALARPRALRQDEMVPSRTSADFDRHAVPAPRDPEPGEIEHRRRHVEVVVEPFMDPWLHARPTEDGGNVAGGLVGRLVIGVHAELPERLTVVAC